MTEYKLVSLQEDIHTEYKSSFTDAVIESLVAFANTDGGRVIVGLNNAGDPVNGFDIGPESIQKIINEVKNKTHPSIWPDVTELKVKGKKVIELLIDEFPVKPVSFKGRYYKRLNNSNHQLSLMEIADLHLRSFNSSWDNHFNPSYKMDQLSLSKVIGFIDKCNSDKDMAIKDDPLTVLTKYELIRNSEISNAAFLLFSEEAVFTATIELGRFSNPTSIKDGLTLREDLFSEVENLLTFVRKHTNKEYIITGNSQREERWQYPMSAIREIAINMIVHRDYTHYGDSSVKIYNDSIEFFNPGRLPESITLERLLTGEYVSETRNKKIALIFKEAQLIEKYGSGIKRILAAFKDYGLKMPKFENFQHGFRVTVYAYAQKNDIVSEGVNEGVSEGVNEGVNSLVHLIMSSPGNRTPFYAKKLGIPLKTVERWLSLLRKQNIIIFEGPPKTGGYWKADK